ncbi:MAG: DUF2244 domain-containing protein [Planktotalea sp.]|uniref:DUF2244 domain-containing protein n=1 Tax=Planktotalea sp. TaxID=2029877 RepID=UPI003C712FF0
MPYQWSNTSPDGPRTLTLWPHQSLPPKGMAAFVLATFTMITLPLFGLLGTKLLWALLPFLLMAVFGIWYALTRSYKDRRILETLTLTTERTRLDRINPRAPDQHWECNTYWVKVSLHPTDGPVPNYITLTGNGRDVEIGAFLSEEERITLYGELSANLRAPF